ncbi:Uncharacterised protein [Vibrio cholerae]|nr:Uncharacterised protein [Vibrio cholerae]
MRAISSMEGKSITSSLRALGTMRGSQVYIPSTSVNIWHSSAFSAPANATALVSEPPRPNVVISPFSLMP